MVGFLVLDFSARFEEEVFDFVVLFEFFREINFFVEVDHLLKIIVKDIHEAINHIKSMALIFEYLKSRLLNIHVKDDRS